MRTIQMMRNAFFPVLCAGLLIGSAPGLAAAQTETPTPASPATPSAPPAMSASTPMMTAHTVIVDPVTTVTTGKAWPQIYLRSNSKTLPDKRVSVDQKSAKTRDAIRDALDQAKIDYVLEADIPEDARVSVKLDNVKVSTALDAITESAGLNWQVSYEQAGRVGSATVHVGKNLPNSEKRSLNAYDVFVQSGDSPNVFTYKTSPASKLMLSHTQATPAPPQSAPSLQYFVPAAPNTSPWVAYTTVARSQETRSTFTCPNCHNQVTIIRKNVEVDCPTCHRPFEAGWKVCPFDGTKRPVAKDDWRFCPICGKAIPDGVATLFSTPTSEVASPQYYAYQPSLSLAPNTYTYDLAPFVAPSPALPSATLPIIHPPAGDYK